MLHHPYPRYPKWVLQTIHIMIGLWLGVPDGQEMSNTVSCSHYSKASIFFGRKVISRVFGAVVWLSFHCSSALILDERQAVVNQQESESGGTTVVFPQIFFCQVVRSREKAGETSWCQLQIWCTLWMIIRWSFTDYPLSIHEPSKNHPRIIQWSSNDELQLGRLGSIRPRCGWPWWGPPWGST